VKYLAIFGLTIHLLGYHVVQTQPRIYLQVSFIWATKHVPNWTKLNNNMLKFWSIESP